MTWSWALVIPTPKPPITNLYYKVYVQSKHNPFDNLSIIMISKQTSEQGGQSPSQHRRLQACRPQSLNFWHFLSQVNSW